MNFEVSTCMTCKTFIYSIVSSFKFQQDRKALYERRKNILYLIHQYLTDINLCRSSMVLQDEAGLSKDYKVCDNVDLETMYMEFCSYFKLKFGKQPKIVKRSELLEMPTSLSSSCLNLSRRPHSRASSDTDRVRERVKRLSKSTLNLSDTMVITSVGQAASKSVLESSSEPFSIQPSQQNVQNSNQDSKMAILSKPLLSAFENYTPEWKELAETICRDLIQRDYGLNFDNVHGADSAKTILYESVVVPLEYPELFSGGVTSWSSVLMHGPPGTGKTMLAKALCSELKGKFAFFNVASSTIISKWRGESEKLIRVLFEVAKLYAPSIIFIDEIDGLTSMRDSNNDHEATKRFKNEFLTLIDGVGNEDNNGVFLLANTNLPWDIDPAFLRRFERKILIELPDSRARLEIFKSLIPDVVNWEKDLQDELADETASFSGDEIRIACKEATMMLIRKNIQRRKDNHNIKKTLKLEELIAAIRQIKPSSKVLLKKHQEWNKKFGNQL